MLISVWVTSINSNTKNPYPMAWLALAPNSSVNMVTHEAAIENDIVLARNDTVSSLATPKNTQLLWIF